LEKELSDFAVQKNIAVPLAFIDPELGLPDSVPVSDDADITLLLYRGRFFEYKIEYLPEGQTKTTNFSSNKSPTVTHLPNESPKGDANAIVEPLPSELRTSFMAINSADNDDLSLTNENATGDVGDTIMPRKSLAPQFSTTFIAINNAAKKMINRE